MVVLNIFHGSETDIYIHWLILGLGFGVLISGIAVLTSCRSIARIFKLLNSNDSVRTRFYRSYYQLHSLYWIIFPSLLVLHLIVTITHLGLPARDTPFNLAHQIVIWTAITNMVFLAAVLTSCRTIAAFIEAIMSRNPLTNKSYSRFYRYHSYFWWPLAVSLGLHMIFGIYHAVNT